MTNLIIGAIIQIAASLGLSFLVFRLTRIFRQNLDRPESFREFIGVKLNGFRPNREFSIFLLGFATIGSLVQIFEFRYFPEFVRTDSSPFFQLQKGFRFSTIFSGFIYCYLQAALSEEILFRGLIAKRLIASLGFQTGNVIQALLFWLVHFLMLGLITKEWISSLQLLTLFSVFSFGWICCYYNERKANGSVFPSWLFHGTGNFATFLTLTILLS